jgi:hypothetical protein
MSNQIADFSNRITSLNQQLSERPESSGVAGEILTNIVGLVEAQNPDKGGSEKEEIAVKMAIEIFEQNDHKIPIIGQWADLPWIDYLQAWAIRFAIRKAWAWALERGWATSSMAR